MDDYNAHRQALHSSGTVFCVAEADLKEQVEGSHNMSDTYETVVARVQLALVGVHVFSWYVNASWQMCAMYRFVNWNVHARSVLHIRQQMLSSVCRHATPYVSRQFSSPR